MCAIRRIHVDEAPAVRELIRAATLELAERSPEDRIAISEQGLRNLETQLRLGAVHQDEVTLVAVDGEDELLGFATGWITRGRATPGLAGEIHGLYVAPCARGRRIERGLAEAGVAWLRAAGAEPIFHYDDAGRPEREPWRSLGFTADVVRFSLYDEEHPSE